MSAVKKLNIVDIERGLEELANRNLSPEEYGKKLIALFGSSATLKRLGTNKANTSEFENGLLWREKIHYVPCSPGKLNSTLDAVKKSDKTLKAKVRLVAVNDGSHILVYDRKYDELTDCTIDKIKDEPQLFLPLAGQEGFRREEESEVDIKATGKLAKVYDALIEENPEWLEGDKRHALNHFMTQVIFCLFAEDTGIFPKDILSKALRNRAGSEGEHATQVITEIFGVLDLDEPHRKDIASWLTEFPYVNGGLFSGDSLVPQFTPKAYRYLLEAASLDWKHINPDILGSSIQAIVDPTMRGNLGMHYTSVPNILKTLEPLFLNELRDDLLKARHSQKLINAFLERLSKIVVFDPACGSGNFLVIAYRELRKLELQALDALRDIEGGASLAFGFNSVISLSNFYGIEYADFAAETAKLALWIVEYQQNLRFKAAFSMDIPVLPLKDSGQILWNNSLKVDWLKFCKNTNNEEVFIVGNPPYLGSTWMKKSQKEELENVFASHTRNYKTLDYVCAWFVKASEYIKGKKGRFAFVATNSIVQGGHVPILWPIIFGMDLEIGFAHKSFHWRNNAADNAGVTCVIVGVRNKSKEDKYLFDEQKHRTVKNINGYLLDAENIEVSKRSKPLSDLPPMDFGSKSADGGHLILTEDEKNEILESYPNASNLIKQFVGSQELIRGFRRFCLWIDSSNLETAMAIPPISERISLVRQMRESSAKKQTRDFASVPFRFAEVRQNNCERVVVVPRVSSENRDYLPVDLLTNGAVISDRNFGIYDGPLWTVALIASRMHWLWISTVCVRLRNDFSYSNTLGWNTFPIPKLSTEQKNDLESSARNILLVRERHFPKCIAELYAQGAMPNDLMVAHLENDKIVEEIFGSGPFKNDEERVSHLFECYVKLTQGGGL